MFHFDEQYIDIIFEDKHPAIFYFYNMEQELTENDKHNLQVFQDLARTNRDKLYFVTSDIKDGLDKQLAQHMDALEIYLPTIRLLVPEKNETKYEFGRNL